MILTVDTAQGDQASERGPRMWLPSPEVEAKVTTIFHDDLPILDIAPLSDWLARALKARGHGNTDDLDIYSDALFDLSQLVEEMRFEAAAGALYSIGLQKEIAASRENTPEIGLAIPTVVRALLASYMRPTPSPSALMRDPGQNIAGHRVLGGWWAAQLYDSALIRGMSALDRLAVVLFCAGQQPIMPNKHGELMMPSFRKSQLDRVTRWHDYSEWPSLLELLDNPVFKFVKRYRDGFVHQRRTPMQLHGEHATATNGVGPNYESTEGITPEMHLAMVLGFFDQILRPACKMVGALIQAADPTEDPPITPSSS